MKILFAVNEDIFALTALNLLRPVLERLTIQFSVIMTSKVGKEASPLAELSMAEKIFPFQGLFPMVDSLPVNSARFLTPKGFLQHYGVQFVPISSINTPEGHSYVADHNLTISIRFGSIFKPEAISHSRLGIINLHSALLPAYRGILGTFHALRLGETQLGMTLHRITDAGIDTGDILDYGFFDYEKGTSLYANIRKIYEKGVPLIAQAIERLHSGQDLEEKQPLEQSSGYYKIPTSDEVNQFKARNIPLVTPDDITNMTRDFVG